jgi:Protein of unknown function (DUF3108)
MRLPHVEPQPVSRTFSLRRGGRLSAVLALLVACAPTASSPKSELRPPFDAGRLRQGRFVYQTTLAGQDAGTSTISVARLDAQTYRLHNEVTGNFRQTWETTASPAMQPLAATLGLGADDDKGRTMRLSYDGRVVTGSATRIVPSDGPRTDHVSAQLPPDIVDQRVDWAALMALPLEGPGAVKFAVYDPWTGISPVVARFGRTEPVTVPAGTFSVLRVVYRIEKAARGVEQYELWVSETVPRFLVREDFPNGATTQLVRILE